MDVLLDDPAVVDERGCARWIQDCGRGACDGGVSHGEGLLTVAWSSDGMTRRESEGRGGKEKEQQGEQVEREHCCEYMLM